MSNANANIRLRQDTTGNWASVSGSAFLRQGEPGVEFVEANRVRLKIGNSAGNLSSSLFRDLPYVGSDLPLFSATDTQVQLKNLSGPVLTVDGNGVTIGNPVSITTGGSLNVSGVSSLNVLNVQNTSTFSGLARAEGGLTVPIGRTLTSSGTLNASGANFTALVNAYSGIDVTGNISGGTLTTSGTANIGGVLTANAGISTTGTISGGGLTISGANADLRNGLTVSGGATISGLLTANTGISSTGTISGGGLTISGANADLRNGLTVSGGATIYGILTANTGISSTGTISGGGLTISGANADLRNGLTVSGGATIAGILTANTGISSTGTISGGGLTILGANADLRNGLTVSGGATISGVLTATGGIRSTGNISGESISGGTLSTTGTASIGGLLTANAGITVSGNMLGETLTISGTGVSGGRLTIGDPSPKDGSVQIQATTTLSGGANNLVLSSVSGAIRLNNATTVSGLLTANTGISSTGNISGASISGGTLSTSGTAIIGGSLTANNGITVNSGDLTLTPTTGISTLLSQSGDVRVGNRLFVGTTSTYSKSYIEGDLQINGNIQYVSASGAAPITVSGNLTIPDGQILIVNGSMTLSGSTTAAFNSLADINLEDATGTFKTQKGLFTATGGALIPTGKVLTVSGSTVLIGNISGGSSGNFDFSGSNQPFKTSTGTNTIGGPLIANAGISSTGNISGATLSTTGTAIIGGSLTANNGISVSGAFNASGLSTLSGLTVQNSLNVLGATNLSSSLTQTGNVDISTGTGNVTLNGDTTVVLGKNFTAGTSIDVDRSRYALTSYFPTNTPVQHGKYGLGGASAIISNSRIRPAAIVMPEVGPIRFVDSYYRQTVPDTGADIAMPVELVFPITATISGGYFTISGSSSLLMPGMIVSISGTAGGLANGTIKHIQAVDGANIILGGTTHTSLWGSTFKFAEGYYNTADTTPSNAFMVLNTTANTGLFVGGKYGAQGADTSLTASGGLILGNYVTGQPGKISTATNATGLNITSANGDMKFFGNTGGARLTVPQAAGTAVSVSGGLNVSGSLLMETTENGQFRTGQGDVYLNGSTAIAEGRNFTMGFSTGSGNGTFSTGTGTVTLNGPVKITNNTASALNVSGLTTVSGLTVNNTLTANGTLTAAGATFSSGVTANGGITVGANQSLTMTAGSGNFSTATGGTVSLNGDVTIAANKSLTMTAGNGTFSTGSGDVTLNGPVNITNNTASALNVSGLTTVSGLTVNNTLTANGGITLGTSKSLTMDNGTNGTFTTGTGAVALNGDVTIAANKSLTMTAGNGTFSTGTGVASFNGPTKFNSSIRSQSAYLMGDQAQGESVATHLRIDTHYTNSGVPFPYDVYPITKVRWDRADTSTGYNLFTISGAGGKLCLGTTVTISGTLNISGGETIAGNKYFVIQDYESGRNNEYAFSGNTAGLGKTFNNSAGFINSISGAGRTFAGVSGLTGVSAVVYSYENTGIFIGGPRPAKDTSITASGGLILGSAGDTVSAKISTADDVPGLNITSAGGDMKFFGASAGGARLTVPRLAGSAVSVSGGLSVSGALSVAGVTTSYNGLNLPGAGYLDGSTVSGVENLRIRPSTNSGAIFLADADGNNRFAVSNSSIVAFQNVTISGASLSTTGNGAITMNSTGSGAFTTGQGDVSLNGNVTIAANKNLTMTAGGGNFSTATGGTVTLNGEVKITNNTATALNVSGLTTVSGLKVNNKLEFATNGVFDLSGIGSGGTIKLSGTGAGVPTIQYGTLSGGDITCQKIDVYNSFTQTGNHTFTTGTGTVLLKGNTTVDADKTFTTGTGTVLLKGNTTVDSNKTFSTGTGTVALNGPTTVYNTLTMDTDRVFTASKILSADRSNYSIASYFPAGVTQTTASGGQIEMPNQLGKYIAGAASESNIIEKSRMIPSAIIMPEIGPIRFADQYYRKPSGGNTVYTFDEISFPITGISGSTSDPLNGDHMYFTISGGDNSILCPGMIVTISGSAGGLSNGVSKYIQAVLTNSRIILGARSEPLWGGSYLLGDGYYNPSTDTSFSTGASIVLSKPANTGLFVGGKWGAQGADTSLTASGGLILGNYVTGRPGKISTASGANGLYITSEQGSIQLFGNTGGARLTVPQAAGTAVSVSGGLNVTGTLTANGDVTIASGKSLTVTGATLTGFFLPGMMMMWGGSSAPTGWLLCDGTSYNRSGTYADLFNAISTVYGSGSGSTFNVPDTRARTVRGVGSAGSTTVNLAAKAGADTTSFTISAANLPQHRHTIYAGGVGVLASSSGGYGYGTSSNIIGGNITITDASATDRGTYADDGTTKTTNSGISVTTTNQYIGINYIIKF